MVQLINSKQNIFNDNIAYVEQWDFSRANLNEESRINAITQVASICYQNPKALNSESLYNRLMAESIGLPSSSFEFVPVLLSVGSVQSITDTARKLYFKDDKVPLPHLNIRKFGEYVCKTKYLLTNLRALIADVGPDESLKYFNTEEECEIIKQYFKVFNYKVDLPTRSQMVRHRVSWQELSRRYVSGERVHFDFYISEKMKDVKQTLWIPLDDSNQVSQEVSTKDLIDVCIRHYKQALSQGVKPQEARRIIPQAAYTQIWGAFMPKQLDNFFKLRLDEHSQWEIQQTAIAMQELIKDVK